MEKWKVLLIVGAMVLGCAGCGEPEKKEIGAVDVKPVDVVQPEGGSSETELANAPTESGTEELEPESAEDLAEEKNGSYEDLVEKAADGDVAAFAQQIQEAVADKDLEALAKLCAFPLAIDGEAVENEEAFMVLGTDTIFTEERCAAIGAVDVFALEETMAGVVMGDGTPNIIFKSVDGTLRITGIN